MRNFTVRPSINRDHPGLHRLWVTVWTTTYGPTLGTTILQKMISAISPTDISDMMPGTGEVALVAAHDSQIIGSAVFRVARNTTYLWGMYVLPEWQRSGVGRELLLYVLAHISRPNCVEVRVLTTSLWAQHFYVSQGFRKVGDEAMEIAKGQEVPAMVMALACH